VIGAAKLGVWTKFNHWIVFLFVRGRPRRSRVA